MSHEWPADAAAIDAARAILAATRGRVVIACHSDVDGLTSAIIVRRALSALSLTADVLISSRGEHIHTASMREKVSRLTPQALVVLDMGTRPGPIAAGVTTVVIDHHDASEGVPGDAVVVNGYDRPPVATTSVLTYVVCRDWPHANTRCWLAVLGAIADLGTASAFAASLGCRGGGKRWSEAVALLNAARRAPQDDSATALRALEHASGVDDLLDDSTPGVRQLRDYRRAVAEEVARCSRIAPQRVGAASLIRFSSGAQVHPLVAIKWTRRLSPAIVIAANDGYLPGRVNFAIRCAAPTDLLAWLRSLDFVPHDAAEYANGHPRATGGSLTPQDFEHFLAAVAARPA